MYEGIIVIFEVGLAILRMFQDELLQFDDQVELTRYIRKATSSLQNPHKLRKFVNPLPPLPPLPSFLTLPFLLPSLI
jgi:hypothetical protein